MFKDIENISTVKKMFQKDDKREIFKLYIEYIRFPYYKNFSENLKIAFLFPITFLVGQNGTGKSSLLHALYGSPTKKSVSDFWFTTEVDPIIEFGGQRNCLIYGYISPITKNKAEVLKTRIQKQGNPEYWEPARPQLQYNMSKDIPEEARNHNEASKTRWKTLDKEVYYLDFRYELSAFDKYFYFGIEPKGKTIRTKQDLIRKYASKLDKAYSYEKEIKYYSRKATKPTMLTQEELETISFILGKEYIKALILEHDFYELMKGFSIKYKTKSQEYSEAYAGSGETAVVKLVHDIYNAKEYSLVLLDEPETSLHPGAQQRLILFLIEQIKQKKLQIVVSTHSPDIIRNMPKESIKVFYTNPKTNKTEVVENVIPEESFSYIGYEVSDKKIIIVEDLLAKMIIEKVLEKIGGSELFDIKYFPGGESRIKQDFMSVYSKEESKKHFIIFDGDQETEKKDVKELSDKEKSITNLKEIIKKIAKQDIEFFVDGKDGKGNDEQKKDLMLKYITFHKENVFYLPRMIPEEIIWVEEIFKTMGGLNKEAVQEIEKESNIKKKFNIFAKHIFGNNTASEQNSAYKMFLTKWIDLENSDFQKIKNILNKIKEI